MQESGPLELGQIAAEACLLLPSLTRMVPPMVDEGLIARRTPPEDRRKVVLTITAVGQALIQAHSAQSGAMFARIEARFGKGRLEHLLDLLEELQTLDLRNPD